MEKILTLLGALILRHAGIHLRIILLFRFSCPQQRILLVIAIFLLLSLIQDSFLKIHPLLLLMVSCMLRMIPIFSVVHWSLALPTTLQIMMILTISAQWNGIRTLPMKHALMMVYLVLLFAIFSLKKARMALSEQ